MYTCLNFFAISYFVSRPLTPFVFCSYLLPTTDRSSKQKTPVCRKTICPRWEQTLRWDDLTLTDLTNSSLELTVWDHDRLPGRHSECLGGARFNLGTGSFFIFKQSIEPSLLPPIHPILFKNF
jgi:hypothetical protein